MTLLPYLERYSISKDQPVIGTVIWLHGLGASGHDFEPLVTLLGLKHNLRFIFPHAPERAVTINGGMVMPSWYDILSMGFLREVNWQDVEASVLAVKDLIAAEAARGVPSERVILAGFSQGGAIILQTALNLNQKLAGVLALSTYVLQLESVPTASESLNAQTPFEMMHGTHDQVVPYALGEKSSQAILRAGYKLNWKTYPMQHQVCDPQIRDMAIWYQQRAEELAAL